MQVLELFKSLLLVWLPLASILSGAVFYYDKKMAEKGRRRVSEKTLHLFELLGGAFANLILIYAIHHKKRKNKFDSLRLGG